MAKDRLIEGFLQDCANRGMTIRSREYYLTCIKIYLDFLQGQGKDFITVDKDILKGFIEYLRLERRVSLKSIKSHLAALSSFYEYLTFEGQVPADPILPIRKHYIWRYKDNDDGYTRRLISVEEMAS